TRTVLDDEWLTKPLRQPLAHQTRGNVVPTACGKPNNPAHRPRRISLRPRNARHGGQCGSTRGQMQKISTGKFHLNPPSLARLRVRAPWQAHRKHRAFARLARHGYVAAHHARELAREGKAEPRAAEALSGRPIGLAELLEQLSLLLRSHANAGVGDGELDEGAAIAHLARLQLDLTLFGELAGIAQQVEQDLPQPHRVDG